MKTVKNITAVYLLFGAVIAIALSAGGLYQGLYINQALGAMTMQAYLMLMIYIVLMWFPTGVFLLMQNEMIYINYIYYKPILATVLCLFLITVLFVSFKTLRKSRK